jgi:hypothetical protein
MQRFMRFPTRYRPAILAVTHSEVLLNLYETGSARRSVLTLHAGRSPHRRRKSGLLPHCYTNDVSSLRALIIIGFCSLREPTMGPPPTSEPEATMTRFIVSTISAAAPDVELLLLIVWAAVSLLLSVTLLSGHEAELLLG